MSNTSSPLVSQPSSPPEHTITDRFRVRRAIALLALWLLAFLFAMAGAAVFWSTDVPANRISQLSSFLSVLSAAAVSLVLGYKASVVADDRALIQAETQMHNRPRDDPVIVGSGSGQPDIVLDDPGGSLALDGSPQGATGSTRQDVLSPVAQLLADVERQGVRQTDER